MTEYNHAYYYYLWTPDKVKVQYYFNYCIKKLRSGAYMGFVTA